MHATCNKIVGSWICMRIENSKWLCILIVVNQSDLNKSQYYYFLNTFQLHKQHVRCIWNGALHILLFPSNHWLSALTWVFANGKGFRTLVFVIQFKQKYIYVYIYYIPIKIYFLPQTAAALSRYLPLTIIMFGELVLLSIIFETIGTMVIFFYVFYLFPRNSFTYLWSLYTRHNVLCNSYERAEVHCSTFMSLRYA